MSCIPLTDRHRRTLRDLVDGTVPTDSETLEELLRWGWVMPASLELTGVGRSHAESLPRGVLGAEG
jgi:hypothetical protein